MATSTPDLSGFTYSGSGTNTQPASAATGDQGILSGLSDLFSSVGTAVAQDYRAVQTPTVVGPKNAGVVYNPSTGQYTSVYGVAGQSTLMPLLLLLGIGVALYVVFHKG
jgi:hypothetical protein